MIYDELVKDLRTTERICRDRMDGQVMLDAAAAIEALEAEVNEQKQIAAHYEQTAKDYWKEACDYKAQLPHWVSVEEKPTKEGEYLTVSDDGYTEVNWWSNNWEWMHDTDSINGGCPYQSRRRRCRMPTHDVPYHVHSAATTSATEYTSTMTTKDERKEWGIVKKLRFYRKAVKWLWRHRAEDNNRHKWRRMMREVQE